MLLQYTEHNKLFFYYLQQNISYLVLACFKYVKKQEICASSPEMSKENIWQLWQFYTHSHLNSSELKQFILLKCNDDMFPWYLHRRFLIYSWTYTIFPRYSTKLTSLGEKLEVCLLPMKTPSLSGLEIQAQHRKHEQRQNKCRFESGEDAE